MVKINKMIHAQPVGTFEMKKPEKGQEMKAVVLDFSKSPFPQNCLWGVFVQPNKEEDHKIDIFTLWNKVKLLNEGVIIRETTRNGVQAKD